MSNQPAPLALRADAPAVFGSRDEVKAIADRISVMLPSAHLSDTQMKRADRDELQKTLDKSIYRAAQLCVFYRLVPGEDVHVIPFGRTWAVDMGIETWRKAADRYCSLHGITYHIHTEEMSLDELKERRGADYHADDCGVVAYLWRSDKKDAYEIFGAKQSMSRAAGIWAKQSKWIKPFEGKAGYWQEDNIPTQRSKQDVAKRRAMKAVLKLEFSLDSLLAATPAEVRQNVQYLESDIRHEEMRRAVPNDRRPEIDEDGFIVVEATKPRHASQDVEFVVADDEEPDVDELFDQEDDMADTLIDDSPEPEGIDYRSLARILTGAELSFVQWTKRIHGGNGGPASIDQYRYLVGVLNSITGDKTSYRLLLGVMVGRHVDSSQPPNVYVCSKLLEWLVEFRKDEVTGAKVKNPAYRADYVETVKAIWQTVSEVQS